MKILLVEPFAHRPSHSRVYPKYMSQALADSGSDVTLITFDGVLDDWTEKDARIKHISVLSKIGIFTPVLRSLSRLLRSVIFLRLFNLAFDTFFTFLLAFGQNRKQRYDVIHILDASMPTLSPFAFALIVKNCSIVCTLHSICEQSDLKDWYKNFGDSLKKRDYSFCRRLLLAKLEDSKFATTMKGFLYRRAIGRNRIAFVCYTKEVQDSYRHSIFYDKVVYVPDARQKPPVLTQQKARQYLGLPQDEKFLLSFGFNAAQKNYEVIFQAVQSLPKDFKLLFAGEMVYGPENDPEQLAEKYGLMDNTIIVDKYIRDEEMPYYFYAADALILSYRKEFLSLSGTLLYAYQCNLPAIASDGEHLGKFVRAHNLGLTFIPEDPHSLREAILTFLKLGEGEKQAMKKGISEFVSSDRSWEQMAKGYLDLYQSLSGRQDKG